MTFNPTAPWWTYYTGYLIDDETKTLEKLGNFLKLHNW